MKHLVKILALVIPGIALVFLLLSIIWNTIVSSHLKQLDKTLLSPTTLEATQEALTEKASYQAAEFRAKRVKEEAESHYEIERLRLKIEMLPRYAALNFYSIIGIISVFALSLIVLAYGYAKAKIQQSSICTARIGQHSEIPVHYQDLPNFYPIAVNLSLAEIQASISNSHENAYQMSRQMIEDITSYTRAIAGKRGLCSSAVSFSQDHPPALVTATFPTQVAELLKNGVIASGKSLFLGYNHQGQAQYRTLYELKTLAVAGWQGSGKTRSLAYLAASSVLAANARAYIIDPHQHQPESLSSLLQPLVNTSHVSIINPFHTPKLLKELHATLKRRMNGDEPANPGILLVIDELAGLASMEYFNLLLAFLEQCTEEASKTNMVFMGSSEKWTIRNFHGREDIRNYMRSMLIHKTKLSQTELLLEDAQDRLLIKQLHQPGEALLMTDYHAPTVVTLPMCTHEDIQSIASIVGNNETADDDRLYALGMKNDGRKKNSAKSSTQVKMMTGGMRKLSQA
ncbi:hypothetical protein U27_06385 [Candidatus Vecturithrix granuli]|uniref:ORC1/DEAH AAA+ ATPase domain-containing protein n=1 Tax=Vecturithrix granuli TaxID=1499967 RepID=A0A081C496_VECG1|nr:hypothetical protein U27_06385 [Candidatus Vecturithrix granuli]